MAHVLDWRIVYKWDDGITSGTALFESRDAADAAARSLLDVAEQHDRRVSVTVSGPDDNKERRA